MFSRNLPLMLTLALSLVAATGCASADDTGAEPTETNLTESSATLKTRIAKALKTAGIPKASVKVSSADVTAQEALAGNKVKFDDAFAAAIKSFLHDGRNAQSPLGLLGDMDVDDLPSGCTNGSDEEKLRCVINSPETTIELLKVGQAAQNGESVKQNWVFTMKVTQISNHSHFAIVSRARGNTAYNYGFTPSGTAHL